MSSYQPTSLNDVFGRHFDGRVPTGCNTSGCHGTGAGGLEFKTANDFYAATSDDPAGFDQIALPSESHSLGLGAGAYGYYPGVQYFNELSFAGYSLALLQNSIWLGRSWSTTLKSVFDGLVYALITAGTFGWLWPK